MSPSRSTEDHTTSRRAVLAAGTGLASALAIGATSLVLGQERPHDATPVAVDRGTPVADPAGEATGPDLVEPEVRASVDGVLETSLTAAFGPVTINGQEMTSRVFDGSYPAPTLKVRPGDTIRLRVTNELDDVTNLHTHGFHTSPSGNSDNIFVEIQPGERFDYEIAIPDDHAAGLYWYHPHVHGDTFEHVNSGMAGAIIIEGGLDDFTGISGLTDRLLVLQSSQFDANGVIVPVDEQSTRDQLRTVNGQVNPTIRIRPGETQRWRIANATSETFCLLALEGHLLHQIAKDGQPLSQVRTQERILVMPGERIEALVQAAGEGSYELRQLLWGTGFQSQPDVVLATMVVAGEAVAPAPLPEALIPFEDLRDAAIDRRRELIFAVTEDNGGTQFLIDGKTFDMNRVDQTVTLGATEEWVIINASDEWHPFHIHVNDFQVVAVNGEPVEVYGWEDTHGVPPNGSFTMRTRFLDYTGKYVYHCHILFHEDAGMMGVVEVVG